MIPWLWIRLLLVIAFSIWLFYRGAAWVGVLALILAGLTVFQLVSAYRQR
ncbi:membrane protein [Corynebacterium atypicum]|uniref:Membrane protein n=2 Tax=Corynebacterium atypicum TaxID=191610 RepID=A0ABM5QMZ5_9CORY|nr:membrane protein [Corynebacterium atypicum]